MAETKKIPGDNETTVPALHDERDGIAARVKAATDDKVAARLKARLSDIDDALKLRGAAATRRRGAQPDSPTARQTPPVEKA